MSCQSITLKACFLATGLVERQAKELPSSVYPICIMSLIPGKNLQFTVSPVSYSDSGEKTCFCKCETQRHGSAALLPRLLQRLFKAFDFFAA